MATSERLFWALAKVESTYGTDPTPVVGTDDVLVVDPLFSQITVEHIFPNERVDDPGGDLLANVAAADPVTRIATIELGWRIRGKGSAYAAGTDIPASPLLRSCGLTESVDTTGGAEKVEYTPADTSHSSCTIWAYAAGKLYKVTGCRGTVAWPLDVGQLGVMRFTMQGIVTSITEVAVPTVSVAAVVPPAATGLALTIAAYTPAIFGGEFRLGAAVSRLVDGNGTLGVAYEISRFIAESTLNIRVPALSDYDPYTDFVSNSTAKGVNWTLGSAQYNRAKLVNTNSHLRGNPGHSVNEDFTAYDLTFRHRDVILRFD